MHLTSISRNLALPFLFADTMLFLSSNFGHILRSIDTAVRVSTVTERRERKGENGSRLLEQSRFLPLPSAKGKQSLSVPRFPLDTRVGEVASLFLLVPDSFGSNGWMDTRDEAVRHTIKAHIRRPEK